MLIQVGCFYEQITDVTLWKLLLHVKRSEKCKRECMWKNSFIRNARRMLLKDQHLTDSPRLHKQTARNYYTLEIQQ